MVIEEIPLALVLHNRMVVGPAVGRGLLHYQTLILERSKWTVAHRICQSLSVLPYPWICQIVFSVFFECERSLLESLWKVGVKLLRRSVQFQHVVIEAAAAQTHSGPVDIC